MPEARRIVSLLPAATEVVAALGAFDRLVGVTHECDEPALVRTIPRVTSSRVDVTSAPADVDAAVAAASVEGAPLFTLDATAIVDLRPDLIITQGLCDVCAVSEGDVRAIAAAMTPAPAILTLSASRLDDVFESIAQVAAAIGARDEAEELLGGIRVRLRRVHETLKQARAPRPRVAVIEWTDPVYAAGHWVPDMVRRAGGIDVLAEGGSHSARLGVDVVRAAAPDVIVIAACGYDAERSAREGTRLLARPEWRWASGLRVWSMDGNALTSRPGPRLCVGVETMARIFNPSLFTPVAAANARQLTHS